MVNGPAAEAEVVFFIGFDDSIRPDFDDGSSIISCVLGSSEQRCRCYRHRLRHWLIGNVRLGFSPFTTKFPGRPPKPRVTYQNERMEKSDHMVPPMRLLIRVVTHLPVQTLAAAGSFNHRFGIPWLDAGS